MAAAIFVLMAACGYAVWDSGVAPFTASSYWAVGVPVAILALVVVSIRRPRTTAEDEQDPRDRSSRRFLPTVMLIFAAVLLEAAGLALGGRSPSVPTLSTVLDHLLRWRALRAGLVVAWLCAGFLPVVAIWIRRRSPEGG